MSKAARGAKRTCSGCEKKFYDLNRDPIVCPLCGTIFEIEEEQPEDDAALGEDTAAAVAETEGETKADTADLPPAEPAATPDAEPAIVATGDDDLEDELADLATDDPDIVVNADDDTFLEEDEDDEADVSGIIGAPIPKEEEES